MSIKSDFFGKWFWFTWNNSGLALGMALQFYSSVAKELKLKVRKLWGLILIFGKIIGEKLEGGLHSTSWKFSRHFVHIVRTDWNIFITFRSSDPVFSRSLLTFLYLKFETFEAYFLQGSWYDMNLKLTLGILCNEWK